MITSEIYKLLPGATNSTLVLTRSLEIAKWIPNFEQFRSDTPLAIAQTFACIAMFETGICNLDPSSLSEAFAMSSGNSLYVAGTLLCDPYKCPRPTEIQRVIGNIGQPGISFLISPSEVKIRDANPQNWALINHNSFDGKPENCFQRTSIHLSFTEYEMSLQTEDNPRHTIDKTATLVESLISVYDQGEWIGELGIIKALAQKVHRCCCVDHHSSGQPVNHKWGPTGYQETLIEHPQLKVTRIENWDELIEAPLRGNIAVRVPKNWLARLAATALCVNFKFTPIVLPEYMCWTCCATMIRKESNERCALIC